MAENQHFDVVIVGGAMMGWSAAWWLANNQDFDGTICVVERDPTLEFSSTARTGSCVRHQYTCEINVQMSIFGSQFIRSFHDLVDQDIDDEVQPVILDSFGYLYLGTPDMVEPLRDIAKIQNRFGAKTRSYDAQAMKEKWPFLNVDDLAIGCHNAVGEGWFDGDYIMKSQKRIARKMGVGTIAGEVVDMQHSAGKIEAVILADGQRLTCDHVVNAAGPRGREIAKMVDIDLPVEPRKRSTFVFAAQNPPKVKVPLMIDPSGVYVVNDSQYFRCATTPKDDQAVAYDDFEINHDEFEDEIWPVLAHRVPAFEAIKVQRAWAGHYSLNVFDHNAIIGFHPMCENLIFMNGFSGHGLQQSPAMGRGVSELICYREFRSLDLGPLSFDRIIENRPLRETHVI